MRFAASLAVILFAVSSQLAADSDGYFCVGPTYLAYEFSFSDSVPGHNLFIIELSDTQLTISPVRIQLPEFQVHGMMCGNSVVEVLGWETIHRIGVGNRTVSLLGVQTLERPGSTPDGFEHQEANLGSLRQSTSGHALGIAGSRFRYELRFETDPRVNDALSGTTDLVRFDGADRVDASYRIYDGPIRQE